MRPNRILDGEISLEELTRRLFSEDRFSHNSVSFSLADYCEDSVLNPDWIYFFARDIENNREQLRVRIRKRDDVSTKTLYMLYRETINPAIKKRTNPPQLPHKVYFELIRLIQQNPEKYRDFEGYIQLARDLQKNTETNIHLGDIWTVANQRRNELNWKRGERIGIHLDSYDTLNSLIEENFEKYRFDEGYMRLVIDLRERTGRKINLTNIWKAANRYMEKLDWTGEINPQLNAILKSETYSELTSQKTPKATTISENNEHDTLTPTPPNQNYQNSQQAKTENSLTEERQADGPVNLNSMIHLDSQTQSVIVTLADMIKQGLVISNRGISVDRLAILSYNSIETPVTLEHITKLFEQGLLINMQNKTPTSEKNAPIELEHHTPKHIQNLRHYLFKLSEDKNYIKCQRLDGQIKA